MKYIDEQLLHRISFLRLTPIFALGIFVSSFCSIDWYVLGSICVLLFLFIFLSIYCKKEILRHLVLPMFLCLGMFLFSLLDYKVDTLSTNKTFYRIELLDYPSEGQKSFRFLASLHDFSEGVDQNLMVYISKDRSILDLHPGDYFYTQCLPKRIINRGNPFEFDYEKFMSRKNIFYSVYIKKLSSQIYHDDSKSLVQHARIFRRNIINVYRKAGIDEQNLAILSALTLGDKTSLAKETKSTFSNSGSMHILAVSGLHVGIVASILHLISLLFGQSKIGKTIRTIFVLSGLCVYAILTGLSASVVRSCVMFGLFSIAFCMSRQSNSINIVLGAAFLQLAWNPHILWDIGFQLSYSAVLGILILYPLVYKRLFFHFFLWRYLWGLFCISFVAQISTFPVAIHYFHRFPNYGLLSNFVTIPLTFLIIIGALFVLCLSLVPTILPFAGKILNSILSLLNRSLAFVSNMPLSVTSNLSGDLLPLLFLFASIVLFMFLVFRKKKSLIFSFVIFTLLSILSFNLSQLHRNRIYRLQNARSNFLFIIDQKEAWVIHNDQVTDDGISRIINPIVVKLNIRETHFVSLSKDTSFVDRDLYYKNGNLLFQEFMLRKDSLIVKNNKKININPIKGEDGNLLYRSSLWEVY